MNQGCYCQSCKKLFALPIGTRIPHHLDSGGNICAGIGNVPRLLSAGMFGGPVIHWCGPVNGTPMPEKVLDLRSRSQIA